MSEKLTPEAKAYAEERGLIINWDLANRTVERPEVRYNLSLKLFTRGVQVPCTNSGDVALLRNGDELEMRHFNRFVKRALALQNKGRTLVVVKTNKVGLLGVEHDGRFLPFNAMRGCVEFGVVSLIDDRMSRHGSYESI